MNRMTKTLAVGLLACGLHQGAFAQTPADAQNKLLAKRAAEADCYRKLAETIKGVQITSDTYVRDFVTESDVIESELDTFIKGVRLGKATYYEDGTCEVEAEVTVAQLITHLKEIHTRHYTGSTIKGTDFENIKQYIKKDVIKCIGSGAPRMDLPPDLPAGVEEVLTSVTVSTERPVTIPDIWKTIPPNERLKAARAAELDAKRKLLERIKGLRINSNTLVKDFVTEYDEIRAEAGGIIIGSQQKGRPYYHHDELIVDVTVEVPTEQVITQLTELHTRHYHGNSVSGTDITRMKQQIKKQTFEATGSGVPAAQYVEVAAASVGESAPDWVTQVIKATGNGTDPNFQTAQGKLKARRAAELDAKRKLAEQVYGFRLTSDTLVRDFVTEYDDISSQLNAVLIGAVVERDEFSSDMAEVTVALPARDVYVVLHQHMMIVQRRN